MPAIFTGQSSGAAENRGRVQVLELEGAAPSVVTIPEWRGFEGFKSILTNLAVVEEGSYQFLHTLGEQVFLYVFGDRVGQMRLSGVSFYDNCADNGQSVSRMGIVEVLDYYRQLRLSRRAQPVQVTLAPDLVLEAYLTGFRGQTLDVAQRLFQFELAFALIPD